MASSAESTLNQPAALPPLACPIAEHPPAWPEPNFESRPLPRDAATTLNKRLSVYELQCAATRPFVARPVIQVCCSRRSGTSWTEIKFTLPRGQVTLRIFRVNENLGVIVSRRGARGCPAALLSCREEPPHPREWTGAQPRGGRGQASRPRSRHRRCQAGLPRDTGARGYPDLADARCGGNAGHSTYSPRQVNGGFRCVPPSLLTRLYISPYFVTNADKMRVEMEDAYILIKRRSSPR